jgi:ABC-2 type transport system ATP-binding protein
VLELADLHKRYGETVALDGLRFEVGEGQLFGFVGPNGAGKTTAMRIAMGVLAPDSGQVRWRGSAADAEIRRRFGYMPEERGLYPKMEVADQLSYFGQLHGMAEGDARIAAGEWLERLEIGDRGADKVEELSLGNQQRVQLGVALVHSPELLVLDEPFSGLDPVGVDVLSAVLAEVARDRGAPVIFSSHQLDLVERLCDSVAIIRDGRLVAAGTVEQLRDERAGRRWRVEFSEPPEPGWHARLGGVEADGDDVFELDPETDPDALLDAARAAGRVRAFGPEMPTLTDLFRDVVGRAGQAE